MRVCKLYFEWKITIKNCSLLVWHCLFKKKSVATVLFGFSVASVEIRTERNLLQQKDFFNLMNLGFFVTDCGWISFEM